MLKGGGLAFAEFHQMCTLLSVNSLNFGGTLPDLGVINPLQGVNGNSDNI